MGRKAILVAVCWLTISQAFGDKRTYSSAVPDNESAESAPRLYRNGALGVYASAAPYAAYSFHMPTFIAAPKTAASQVVPVKENFVNRLTDSYGNQFMGAPHLQTYKFAFPQQFIPLQTKLPEHLAQPLVAATNFQFKQSNGQFFGAPFRLPALQGPAPTPLNQFPTFGQLYGGAVKPLAPATLPQIQSFGFPNTQQQSTNNKAVFANTQPYEQYNNLKNEPKSAQRKEPEIIVGKPKVQGIQEIPHEPRGEIKFQRIQNAPHASSGEQKFQKIQEAPYASSGEEKFERIQDAPYASGEQHFHKIHDAPHASSGEQKFQRIQDAPYVSSGEQTFHRIQDTPHVSSGEQKFQRTQEAPHNHYGDTKFQKIQETPHSHHSEPKLKQQALHSSHPTPSSHEEVKYQRAQELPHYETKFQIIEDHPHSSQYQKTHEHSAPREEVKYQHVQAVSPTVQTHYTYEKSQEKPQNIRHNPAPSHNSAKLQAAPAKQTITYINDINGKKTVVELDTKPILPLLDITLLEPLKFDNPLVPQVQHFLPRINQATYQKLPEAIPAIKNYQKEYAIQKTTSYDSAEVHDKPLKEASKKKQKKPTLQNKHAKKNDVPKKTIVTYDALDDAPEITYEINSPSRPNYKETIKEKTVSYNKQTQSEPVHYSYGSKSEKDPVTYSYSRSSKEPVQTKTVQYTGNEPSHLIYQFKPEEHVHVHNEKSHNSSPHHSETENESESSAESDDDHSHHNHHHSEHYKQQPHSSEEHHEPPQKENYHKQKEEKPKEVVYNSPPKYYSEPAQFTSENINFQPILREYEQNIRLLTAPSASIKVDPHQHIQHHHAKPAPQPEAHVKHKEEHSQPQRHHAPQSSPPKHEHHHSAPEPQRESREYHNANSHSDANHGPAPHIHEKSKQIIIQEESPDEMHMLREQMRQEVINREENSEEDFEKAYHDAALGFPAYSAKSSDGEKDIFDPESYGVPRDHVEFDFENTPLQQYQEEGDEFPKEVRSRYKDTRDSKKQNYYSDFSISKPESLLDRYQNKLGYYKLYKEQKPDYLADDDDDDEDKKRKQKSAKFTVAPSFDYPSSKDKSHSFYGDSKPNKQLYEYDYSKEAPRDSSAFASRPYHSYKRRLSFVEPQFQYGFMPVAIPKIDSELAAMASNDSPESEKPGMRKKVYKENWYIKKTSSSAGAPAS